MRRLMRPFWFLLALAFMAEAWLWDHLGPVVGRLVQALPLAALKRRTEALVAALPPHATLLVFAIPALLLFPFKLAALWLLGKGQLLAGALAFLAAKTIGLGVTAFLFEVCRPKLLQIGWFARLYGLMLRLKAWAAAQIAPARLRLKAIKRRLLGGRGRFARQFARLRARRWRRAG